MYRYIKIVYIWFLSFSRLKQQHSFRYFVIHKLPSLQFLDSRRVSSSERREAATRGHFMRVRRPTDVPDTGSLPATLSTAVRPLPVDFGALGKHKGKKPDVFKN